ncbi:hypothetical protein FA13DRAFT_1720777 [Coprinellus micaceus]|uniref:Uncharacterized protein n=1 Tax=Coprinellus micaceus TaxID=71717 RepID=A0A4Y7S6N0_COPMI|nr:hypothetical protein FA13DRAFT_1720777 [Coprinellus micaceus]
MGSPEGINVIHSPHAPSIAPTIRSAASINQALLNQLAVASPSPGGTPASLTAALHDILQGRSNDAGAEQRFKNLVVLALVLVAAGSVGQYLAAAEACADARMYAGAVARVMHKREWDLACLKGSGKGEGKREREREDELELGGRKKRMKLSPSVTSVSDDAGEYGDDENPSFGEPHPEFPNEEEEEEEIPHLVDLEVKNDQIEGDVSWCAHSGQAAMAALASELKWFEENYSAAAEGNQDVEQNDDNDAASQASNPFLESSAIKPKPSSDFDTLETISSTCVPITVGLIDERERSKLDLPVDRVRCDRELEKARKGLQKAEKKWDSRKNDAAMRVITCIAGCVGAIDATLDETEEEFMGLDGDSQGEDDEDVGVKGVLIATLAVAQATPAVCVTSDKWPAEGYNNAWAYPSSATISRPSHEPTSVRDHTLEAAQAQKTKQSQGQRRKKKRRRKGGTCDRPREVVLERNWESEADFWADVEGLEEGDEEEDGGEGRSSTNSNMFGLGTFKLFFNLFKGTEEWEDENPPDLSGVVQPVGADVRSLGPERMGKLKEEDRISSWLRSVTSSPKSTPEPLDSSEDASGPDQGQQPQTGVGPETSGSQAPDETPAEAQQEEGEQPEDSPMEDSSPRTRKLAAVWGSKKKRLSKAKKEASAKALEKARESIARRKQEQLVEERARAERAAAREAAIMNGEDVQGEMKRKQGSTNTKRKGRSKAQKRGECEGAGEGEGGRGRRNRRWRGPGGLLPYPPRLEFILIDGSKYAQNISRHRRMYMGIVKTELDGERESVYERMPYNEKLSVSMETRK